MFAQKSTKEDINFIARFFRRFVDAIKKVFGGNKKYQQYVYDAEKLLGVFERAVKVDGNKKSSVTKTRNAVLGNNSIMQKAIKALRSIGPKSINKFTSDDIKIAEPFARRMFKELGVKSPFFRAWFGDWRVNDIKNPAFTTDIPQNRKYNVKNRFVKNDDTKFNIQITDDLFEDSLHYANKDKQYIERLLSNIDTVLERAILLDTAVSDANKANKKGSSQFMHYLYSVVEYQGAPFLAKITVEEYDTAGKHRAYNAQRIKMSALSRAQYS
ncbi:MAG: hypothetical protein E7583_09255 [Ruminococcaceae bacterium]|nr:hypothetical protein [Oscillospiraceae bacterium]